MDSEIRVATRAVAAFHAAYLPGALATSQNPVSGQLPLRQHENVSQDLQ